MPLVNRLFQRVNGCQTLQSMDEVAKFRLRRSGELFVAFIYAAIVC